MTQSSETPENPVAQPKQDPADGSSEKRRIARIPTDQLLYVELGTGNGGIVLNVSEEGCGFLSIAPVWDDKPHFSFAIGGGRQIQGDGKVVWVDESKKLGGLRFVNPSRAFREQVRAWLAEPKVPEAPRKQPDGEARAELKTDVDIPAAKQGELAHESDDVPIANASEPESELAVETAPRASIESASGSIATAASASEARSAGEPVPDTPARQRRKQLREEARAELERQRAPASSRATSSTELGQGAQEIHLTAAPGFREKAAQLRLRLQRSGWKTVVAFSLAAGLALSAAYHEQMGKVLMRVGTRLAGVQPQTGESQRSRPRFAEPTHVAASQEAAGEPSGTKGSESENTPKPEVSGGAQNESETVSTAKQQVASAQPVSTVQTTSAQSSGEQKQSEASNTQPGPAAPKTSAPSRASFTEPQQTPTVSPSEPRNKGPHVTPQQVQALWSEVEAGDVSAEVHLGQLYATGNGVPKSCGQARMLLASAVKKGSVEAKQKLDELAETGCP